MTEMSATDTIKNIISHCRTQLKLNTFSYIWSIPNFCQTIKCINELYSDKIENFTFSILCQDNTLKFYVIQNSTIKNQPLKISYSVFLNTSNEGEILCTSKPLHNFSENLLTDNTAKERLYELQLSCFNNTIEKYLVNGTLTVRFEISVFVNLFNSSICYSCELNRFATANPNTFAPNEKMDSLVTLIVNEKRLEANKVLLCSKSKVFEAMFNSGLKESTNNEIEITDIKYDILQQLLSFLQTNYICEKVRTNTVVMCELLTAAEKYDIQDLKSLCEQYLIKETTIENVVEHLRIAHLNNGKMLKNCAIELIKLYFENIADTREFIILMQKYPDLLIQIDNVQIINSPVQIPVRIPVQIPENVPRTEKFNEKTTNVSNVSFGSLPVFNFSNQQNCFK